MIDIALIYQNPNLFKEKISQRGFNVDVDKILALDRQRRLLIKEVDQLRRDRKLAAEKREQKLGLTIKKTLSNKEQQLAAIEQELSELLLAIPNLALDEVPVGTSEADNRVIRKWGSPPHFNFPIQDYHQLGESLGIVDLKRAAKVSGSRFGYLLAEGVVLELALVNYAMRLLEKAGFVLVIPPALIKSPVKQQLGYVEPEATSNWYLVGGQSENNGDFYLIGTAEHAIVPFHKDEILEVGTLPKRYGGFSPAFRREAGSYGKDTKGLFRVHQFDKVEMVSFTKPEDSSSEHQFLLSIQEKLVQALGLPYQVVEVCTADMAFPTARQFDIEIWFPSEGRYRETHSTSNTTDFQARRLNIKYRDGHHLTYVHILNGTAVAIGRTIMAILENNQQADGSVVIPEVLRAYTGFSKILPKG